MFGNALAFLRDARGFSSRQAERHGSVFRNTFGSRSVVVMRGADALEYVLLNRDQTFSSELGWDVSLGGLFTGGLMLLDFAEHRFHRRIMNTAFKSSAMQSYLEIMDPVVRRSVAPWADTLDFRFYPAIKQLALDNAAVAFLGLELGPEAEVLNRAFEDAVAASVALFRIPLPGFPYWRGLRGRQILSDFFQQRVADRRGSASADMFTRLCNAVSEDGASFSNRDIVDHIIFLMMAAHDTVTSTLTSATYLLAAHPEWQARLRDEARRAGEGPLRYEELGGFQQTEWVLNEAMRLWCPVPYVPRRALREFEWRGHRIPANAQVVVSPDSAHQDPELWTSPGTFDPMRFSPERAEHKRHAFAFAPFGGGMHKCIGMHFAGMLAKVFLHRFLLSYEFSLPAGYEYKVRQVPIPKPADGLKLQLTPC